MSKPEKTTEQILTEKAKQAQVIYEDLARRFGIEPKYKTEFLVDAATEKVFKKNYLAENPFPHFIKFVLGKLRKKAVNKLFEQEKVLQTPVVAAALTLCAQVATEIGALRGGSTDGAVISSDIAFAGLQAIRLYLANHTEPKFKNKRLESAVNVDNAFNGSFYKYKTKDGRYISFHVYYQSQQEKLAAALGTKKPSEKFTLLSTGRDRKYLQSLVGKYDAEELEELAFSCGACASVLRTREEWEESEVGKAVNAMPLVNIQPVGEKNKRDYGKPTVRGPLSGIKVLDLTHIIAGPACSRILAEYGADVLLVRRGKFVEQEQAMLELDGWAGKNSIQLDFKEPEQLEKCKQLIREADVITYSYQNGCMDKFGLSEEDIRALNPNVIYSNLFCFSDTVWKQRPGWAPCAEDITGLSTRNGSKENPVNLNGVPLDYIPGFFLALGTLCALKKKIEDGSAAKVTTSLTRGACYLHEATDLCEKGLEVDTKTEIAFKPFAYPHIRVYAHSPSLGLIGFPSPATYNTAYPDPVMNMRFEDGREGFTAQKEV
ncbi:MAG: CoA transferase [Clostridiales bacterium]|nr:CoA transferase [Clostridiales bacterium]